MSKPRRQTSTPAHPAPKHGCDGKFKPGIRDIKNPNPVGPDRITVQTNTRHDAVESLFARGSITEAQKQAGDRIRTLYEKMQGSGARGVDLGAVRVDGGQAVRGESITQLQAIETLGKLARVLGKVGYIVAISCAGQGHGIGEIAKRWYGRNPSRSEKDFISGTLQAALGEAAVYLQLQSPSSAPSARLGHLCAPER